MLVDLGVDPYTIDKAIQFGFGMPMGPFRCASAVLLLCAGLHGAVEWHAVPCAASERGCLGPLHAGPVVALQRPTHLGVPSPVMLEVLRQLGQAASV